MKITIIGASKGVGLQTLKRALQRKHSVTTLSRSKIKFPADPKWTAIQGDALRAEDLQKALQGADAVIVTLGVVPSLKPVTLFSKFARLVLELHAEKPFKIPFIVLTGFGAGDSGRYVDFVGKIVFGTLLKDIYADKNRMEKLFATSGLTWVMARPGMLTNGKLTEKYKVEPTLHKGMKVGSISRADVADYLVKQAEKPTDAGKYPALSRK